MKNYKNKTVYDTGKSRTQVKGFYNLATFLLREGAFFCVIVRVVMSQDFIRFFYTYEMIETC